MTHRRDLARSRALFGSFLVEQTDPGRFYSDLARDSVAELADHLELEGALVLDVGAGPSQFADAFAAVGARYLPIDHDPSVTSVAAGGVVGSAERLPLADDSVDLVFSSNLLEHVPRPETVADELLRVVRPGGLLFLSYTNWLSPWGGHETSPWHWIGGERAVRRYQRRHGHPPKNRIGETMFKVSVKQGLAWATGHPRAEVLVARPRYLPDGSSRILGIPVIREFLTWNLLLLVRKR